MYAGLNAQGSSGGQHGVSSFEPLTRSRTNLFLSYRESSAGPISSSSRSRTYAALSSNDDDEGEEEALLDRAEEGQSSSVPARTGGNGKASLPPKWVDLAEQVDSIVAGTKLKLAKLDKLHSKHVLPGFKDRSAEEREIDALANDITKDFRKAQQQIRNIADMAAALLKDKRQTETKRAEMLMAANVQIALATKVQDISTEFRKKQTAYLRQIRGQDRHASPGTSGGTRDPLASLFEDEQYTQTVAQEEEQQQQQQAGPAVETRSKEIGSLATSIVELSDLFKDLNSLVIDQGTLLDRVDYNIEQMRTDVVKAGEELTKASNYQRRSGKCQFIFLLVLLIIGALIILAYKPVRRENGVPVRSIWSHHRAAGGEDVLEVPDSSTIITVNNTGSNVNRRSRGRRRVQTEIQ